MDQLKQLQHLSLVNKVTTGQCFWDTDWCDSQSLHLLLVGSAGVTALLH